jgi:DNA repair exonuclease SbcCD ATPase subunit
MFSGKWLDRVARSAPRFQALQDEVDRLRQSEQWATRALAEQKALAEQQTALAQDAVFQAELLKTAFAAVNARIEELETELYLARSDQQRSAALADSLRARLSATRGSAA